MEVNRIMVKKREGFGMEQVRKNCLKQWAHIWIRLELEIILYHKWLERRSLRLQGEISQTGPCSRGPSSHGSQVELLISKEVAHQHQPNTHLVKIEIIEIRFIRSVSSVDSTCHQVLPTSKNKSLTCTQRCLTVLKHSSQKTTNSKKSVWDTEQGVTLLTQNNWSKYQAQFMTITKRILFHIKV